eukprot:TRINITY_DN4296_c3_g2_i1.p1 TRINITY_DN4296_c3_g2~~TRINITY_DN4296_c3_g2_i1.p1  ORF type:complete len:336 (+),score=71.09 TRINITY_DN4296_c3_g2_i1:66-1010(+)
MPRSTVRPFLRRLEVIAEQVGVQRDDEARRRSGDPAYNVVQLMGERPDGVSEYSWRQREIAEFMRLIRDDMSTLDKYGPDSKEPLTMAQSVKIKNRVRRNLREMLEKSRDRKLLAAASAESRVEDLHIMKGLVTGTERMWRGRNRGTSTFGGASPPAFESPTAAEYGDESDHLLGGGGGGRFPVNEIRQLGVGHDGTEEVVLIDPADDPEFQAFYVGMRQRDVEIDEALDRVAAGAKRLRVHAETMHDELKVQDRLLDKVNQKTDDRLEELKAVNSKLERTLKEVESDKFMCYVICLVLIVGLLGVIGSQVGVF